jgi:hypothetical protein
MLDLLSAGLTLFIAALFAMGLFVGVLILRQSVSERKLVYEVFPPLSLSPMHFGQSRYTLRLEGSQGEEITEPLFLHGVRLINIGRSSITRAEVNVNDPFRIYVLGQDVVDIVPGVFRDAVVHLAPMSHDEIGVFAFFDIQSLNPQSECLFWVISKKKEIDVGIKGRLETPPYIHAIHRETTVDKGCSLYF